MLRYQHLPWLQGGCLELSAGKGAGCRWCRRFVAAVQCVLTTMAYPEVQFRVRSPRGKEMAAGVQLNCKLHGNAKCQITVLCFLCTQRSC